MFSAESSKERRNAPIEAQTYERFFLRRMFMEHIASRKVLSKRVMYSRAKWRNGEESLLNHTWRRKMGRINRNGSWKTLCSLTFA